MSKIIEVCTEIGTPIVTQMGYELVDVEYVKEGRNRVLRYMIDRDEGVDIDDCALISEAISNKLDESDPIVEEYVLEVTSPGAERPLRTKEAVAKAVGNYVHVRLYAPIDGVKEFEGDLVAFQDEMLSIEILDKTKKFTIEVPYEKIASIRLAIRF